MFHRSSQPWGRVAGAAWRREAALGSPATPARRAWWRFTATRPDVTRAPGDDLTAALARTEAALFLAREPLTTRKLAQYADLADGTQARTLVRRLNERYDAEGRAFRVEQVAGGHQLRTRSRIGDWMRKLHASSVEIRMSAPALETLAIIAYRQPIRRAEIESIRGVQCGEMLRQLMERDLVRISGRAEELGRPFLYGTTRRFLQDFGLRGLEELPRAEFLRRPIDPVAVSVENPHNHPEQIRSVNAATTTPQEHAEERDVSTTLKTGVEAEESTGLKFGVPQDEAATTKLLRASDDEDEDWDDEEDEDEDDDDEEDEDDDLEDDDDLDDDWEEVDDEDDEADEEDEDDDEDWEEDEDDEDDDWDDDEDDDEDEEEDDLDVE